MDRREFLIRGARLGALAAIGALAAGCDLIVLPTRGSRPTAGATTPSSSSSPVESSVATGRHAGTAIAVENRRQGSGGWELKPVRPPDVEGYAGRASVSPGERLALHTRGTASFDVEWYRLGWYGGSGGRLLRTDRGLRAAAPPIPVPDPASGLVEPGWDPAVELDIPADWLSGMYVAILRPAIGAPGVVPFVVRSPDPVSTLPAPVLFVSATLTWQAYNHWGGKSLYSYDSVGPPTASGTPAASTVGLDRPFAEHAGAGYLFRWEYQFVRWQEREGRDVEYASDVDLALHPEVLAGRRLVVFAGHHEYWSRPMREALQGAIDGGTSVCFLSANEIYWQARLEDSASGPGRRLTCYKSATRDPLTATQPALTTCRWREAPVSEPEATLVGQMYGHVVREPADWVVLGSSHWVYAGTGLRDGDRLANLVGQEYDTYFAGLAPPGTTLLAHSPVASVGATPGEPGDLPSPPVHTATMYAAGSGATVFAAGTFQWSWALDDYGDRSYRGLATPIDSRVRQMTRNLFDRLGDGPI